MLRNLLIVINCFGGILLLKNFKTIAVGIIASIFIILTIFIIYLFLNFRTGIILAIILVLIIVYLLNKTFLNYIILSTIMVFLIVISTFNSVMYKAISENLNVMQKVNIYSKIFMLDEIKLKTMKSLHYKYATFYYENGEESTIELIKPYIDEVESSTNIIFGKSTLAPLKIVIYKNSQGLRDNFIGFDSADGMFEEDKNSISIIQYTKSITKIQYKKLFFHEFTHYRTSLYLKNNNINNNIPTWFKEGLAEYIKSEKNINLNFKLEKALNFRKLDTEKSFTESDKSPYDLYLQSYLAVNKMINMKGNKIICDILNETKKTDFYNAFKLKMGMNIDMFEKIFLK